MHQRPSEKQVVFRSCPILARRERGEGGGGPRCHEVLRTCPYFHVRVVSRLPRRGRPYPRLGNRACSSVCPLALQGGSGDEHACLLAQEKFVVHFVVTPLAALVSENSTERPTFNDIYGPSTSFCSLCRDFCASRREQFGKIVSRNLANSGARLLSVSEPSHPCRMVSFAPRKGRNQARRKALNPGRPVLGLRVF